MKGIGTIKASQLPDLNKGSNLTVSEWQIENAYGNKSCGFLEMSAHSFLWLTTLSSRPFGINSGWPKPIDVLTEAASVKEYNEWQKTNKGPTPFLVVDPDGRVRGHEGRHRAAALVNENGHDAKMWVSIELTNEEGYRVQGKKVEQIPAYFYGQYVKTRRVKVLPATAMAIE